MHPLRALIHCCVALAALLGVYLVLRMVILIPETMLRTEVSRGVFVTVGEVDDDVSSGKYIIAEIHTRTPGLRLTPAPFDEAARSDGGHFLSRLPDWIAVRKSFTLMVNTVMHEPTGRFGWWPGQPLRCIETVVVDGRASHSDPHTYLIWWDSFQNLSVETEKTPTEEALLAAFGGIGTQAMVLVDGELSPFFANNRNTWTESDSRTFIGVDPNRDILWLIVAEQGTEAFIASLAMDEGVRFGGFLDSGDSTTMIFGRSASGIRPYSGIRGWRPLGAYLMIQAPPL
jgi:hypothetical protein